MYLTCCCLDLNSFVWYLHVPGHSPLCTVHIWLAHDYMSRAACALWSIALQASVQNPPVYSMFHSLHFVVNIWYLIITNVWKVLLAEDWYKGWSRFHWADLLCSWCVHDVVLSLTTRCLWPAAPPSGTTRGPARVCCWRHTTARWW